MSANEQHKCVLFIGNQPHCADVVEQILTDSNLSIRFTAASTIAEARSRLSKTPTSLPEPALILLDPYFAEGQGKHLLEEIKLEEALRHIPVIILSASEQPADIWDSYQRRCNCYVVSPQDREQLEGIVRAIEAFWLNIVTLPRK